MESDSPPARRRSIPEFATLHKWGRSFAKRIGPEPATRSATISAALQQCQVVKKVFTIEYRIGEENSRKTYVYAANAEIALDLLRARYQRRAQNLNLISIGVESGDFIIGDAEHSFPA